VFSGIPNEARQRSRWIYGASVGLHGVLLAWLLHSPAPQFLKPTFIQRGFDGVDVAHLFWPSERNQGTSNEERSTARKRLIYAAQKSKKSALKPSPEVSATEVATSQPPNQPKVAGSSYGTVIKGDLTGDDIRPALPIRSFDPRVDASELPEGILEGDVIVEVTIDEQGNIIEKHVLSSLGPAIDQKVLLALDNWRFVPATKWGRPIASKQDVHYHFPRPS
jgi:TonB family protein